MTYTTKDTDELELLSKFVELLRSNEPIGLPRETVLGAISHYISTLSPSDLQPLFEAISNAEILWETPSKRASTREAICLGVQGAVDRLRAQPGSSRWWRRKDSASAWLDAISTLVAELGGDLRLEMLVAFLSGASQGGRGGKANLWSGRDRERLEDEIVMELAKQLADAVQEPHDERGLDILCEALDLVDGEKLRILDLQVVLADLNKTLANTLSDIPQSSEAQHTISPATLGRSIARLFSILDEGDIDQRRHAWVAMRDFPVQLRRVVARIPSFAMADPNREKNLLAHQKSALLSFLLPSSATLHILLHSDPPSSNLGDSATPTKADIATEALHTLSAFASILDQSEGGTEGYHRVLHGMTDILVACGASASVRGLLARAPNSQACTAADGAWWLNLGESVIREVDERSFEALLERLIQRFIAHDTHRPSFEAAHSLRLASIQAASATLALDSARRARFKDQVQAYSDLLIHRYSIGQLTSDQFRSAYPLLVESAYKHSDQLVKLCISQLRSSKAPSASPEIFGHTRRMVLIACAPHVAPERVEAFLDGLAGEIMATPAASSARVELTGTAFRMVMNDLGDGSRLVGMEWWTRWREKFEESAGSRRREAKL